MVCFAAAKSDSRFSSLRETLAEEGWLLCFLPGEELPNMEEKRELRGLLILLLNQVFFSPLMWQRGKRKKRKLKEDKMDGSNKWWNERMKG